MCGFAGFLGFESGMDWPRASAIVESMAASIAHRGPDATGFWHDADAQIVLGHRRLSILDLSEAGSQPMTSPSGRFVIAFNGEIYNHLRLRAELEQSQSRCAWRGHSDTETLLACFDKWGIEATLKRAQGMFAFALWDRKDQVLTLARDRVGEKPLYYGWVGEGTNATILFGSELKALRRHPRFAANVDRNSLSLFLRHSYIPAPHTVYRDVFKLAPGTYAQVSRVERKIQTHRYWSAEDVALQGLRQPFRGSANEAADQLEVLLRDAVRQQMLSDVPLGAFLSGGIDSSTIVALMQAESSRPIKTFTIGFSEDAFDEAVYAKAVARHLGTEHTELYVSPQQAMDVIPRLPKVYDEPFADSSQIPTILVAQLAKQHVTVALSGDAGDELFAGYNRYHLTRKLYSKLSYLPIGLRRQIANAFTTVPPHLWNRAMSALSPLLPKSLQLSNAGDKIHKGADVLDVENVEELYFRLVSHWQSPSSIVIGAKEPHTLVSHRPSALSALSEIEQMMALDLMTYLPDDILVKVDRAAMTSSLETRVPFLDPRVIAFAWSLPIEYKLRDNETKWPLRKILYRHVPQNLIDRPKMGFGVPIDSWLRGPMREWAEELLSEQRLQRDGYFEPAPIRKRWAEHLSGQRNWQYHLWDILMFQTWLDEQGAESC
jgi:asparagine synthase (glutamine-hydrolysing)